MALPHSYRLTPYHLENDVLLNFVEQLQDDGRREGGP
jgi:hypothetical protein